MWDSTATTTTGEGGGFFDNTNQFESPSGTDKKKDGPKRAQTLFPIVIGMLHESEADEFKFWGESANIVKIVGIVRKFDVTSTKITYEIEDQTGKISAVLWLEQEQGAQPNIPVDKEGVYVRIYGTIRSSGPEKIIMVLKIAPITSLNEPTTHLLEVIHIRYQMEHGNQANSSILRSNNPGASLSNSMMFSNSTSGVKETAGFGMNAMQMKVFKIIKSSENRIGIHRDQIQEQFQKHQHKEVRDAIEFLVSEGHVFSTINAEHFKVTDA